jgi:NAD+ kinase
MTKSGVADQIEALTGWLSECCQLLGAFPHDQAPLDIAAQARLCIVFGGDGTLLSAARSLAEVQVPMLGVNMGKLGFLAEYSVDDLKTHLDDVLAGNVQPLDRLMLQIELDGQSIGPVANDVAISAGTPFRMIDLQVAQADASIAQFYGDGLVVATPTGSTGYNLSVGGPILQPTIPAVVLSPVAPHTLSLRPLVLSPDKPITITADHVNPGTTMTIDGQLPYPLSAGQCITVSRSRHLMRILPHPNRPHFDTLACKLQWGQSPHHNS